MNIDVIAVAISARGLGEASLSALFRSLCFISENINNENRIYL